MPAAMLLRVSSQVLHLILGGIGVFCLYYTVYFSSSDPTYAKSLLLEVLKYGGMATLIVYFQGKYLSNV